MINKLIKTNNFKSFICVIFGKSLNEYREMIKDKRLFIQEIYSHRQLQNKYKTDILLLKEENDSLDSRIKNYEERAVDKKKTSLLISNAINQNRWLRYMFKNTAKEILLCFTDLNKILSQIK